MKNISVYRWIKKLYHHNCFSWVEAYLKKKNRKFIFYVHNSSYIWFDYPDLKRLNFTSWFWIPWHIVVYWSDKFRDLYSITIYTHHTMNRKLIQNPLINTSTQMVWLGCCNECPKRASICPSFKFDYLSQYLAQLVGVAPPEPSIKRGLFKHETHYTPSINKLTKDVGSANISTSQMILCRAYLALKSIPILCWYTSIGCRILPKFPDILYVLV